MENYKKGPVIGEGTYGSVFLAEHRQTGRQVAIKKVRLCGSQREGVNMSVLRELKALQALASPHVVELLDVFSTKGSLVLVFELLDFSLEDVVRDKGLQLSPGDIKAYMQMLLQALAFVHDQQVVHRDIKPDNLLISSSSGVMKLADFGLARSLTDSPDSSRLTPQVFGRWYRPPELLMGADRYGCAVDMWAAGCVLAELLLRRPWLPGNCDMDQLDRIFKALGVPTVESWPGMAELPHRIDFRPAPGTPMQQMFPGVSSDCLDLLQQLMAFDPQTRLSAAAALQHPYFSNSPPPTPPAILPKPQACRAGRSAATIPAMMHDLFMRPSIMLRQQGAGAAAAAANTAPDGFVLHRGAAGYSAWAAAGENGGDPVGHGCLPAFSDQPSFSGRLFGSQPLQALLPQQQRLGRSGSGDGLSRLMGGSSLMQQQQQHGSSRLGPGSLGGLLRSFAEEQDSAGQQAGLQQQSLLGRLGSGTEELPWKGRLSFGAVDNEQQQQGAAAGDTAPLPEGSRDAAAAAAAAAASGEAAGGAADGMQQHQQQQSDGWRRPSPAPQQGKQQGAGGSNSSMRPPLHRGQGTPVLCSKASVAAGPGAAAAATARRQVSDLAAALSSAAGGQQQDAASALDALLANTPTPAAAARRIGSDARAAAAAAAAAGEGRLAAATAGDAAAGAGSGLHEAPASSDNDGACPMSLGTSAHKRSRAVFEAAPGDEQQQQQAGSHSDNMCTTSGRRLRPSRRSSIGTGCCSMDTDSGQPGTAGAAESCRHEPERAAAHDQHHRHQQLQGAKEAELEALLAGRAAQPGPSQQQQQHQGLAPPAAAAGAHLQQLPPWAAPAAGCHTAGHHALHCSEQGLEHPAAAAAAGTSASAHVQHQQQHPGSLGAAAAAAAAAAASALCGCLDSGGPRSSCCPMSLDQQQRAGSSAAQSCGMSVPPSTGLTGRAPPPGFGSVAGHHGPGGSSDRGLPGGGLAALDPADLAELAQWWRPRLDSAERRYLRCRKLQMDEALLQASQPDAAGDEEGCGEPGADGVQQCSPDAFALRGTLFDTPTPAKQQQAAAAPGEAAAEDPAAGGEAGGVLPGCQGTAVTAA